MPAKSIRMFSRRSRAPNDVFADSRTALPARCGVGARIHSRADDAHAADSVGALADRLQRFDAPVPLFVNIGKNRDVALESAPDAYAQCYLRVGRWADGAVLNLSSPNTPGLRELQRPEHLVKVLELVRAVREAMPVSRPILVKIAPDLDRAQLVEICEVCAR